MLLHQVQGAAQACHQGDAAGGHLEAATVVVKRIRAAEVRLALVPQAAPSDQRGLPLLQHPLREGHAPQSFRAAGPLVAGEGVDVCPGGRLGHGDLPEALGGIHQQVGLPGVLVKPFRHSGDRHDLSGVPEQMAEHHQAGAGGERLL